MKAMTAHDKEWEAEDDARALMTAAKLRKDPKRLARAKKALAKIEKEAKETQLVSKVARGLKKVFGDS